MSVLENARRWEKYKVSQGLTSDFVGREREMQLITAAWMGGTDQIPLAPLLCGEPGVGKNRLVYELARRTGKSLYIFQGHEDVTAEDLACSVRPSDDRNRTMDYTLSPLVTAMLEGGICFIDEIAKIRPRALALLVSVLDERRYIDSNLLGERVLAHHAFRFIAATNTVDLESNSLPEFLGSRMRPVINFGYSPQTEVNEILEDRFLRLKDYIEPLLESFWILWQETNGEKPPTPRDAIHVFNLASSIADFEHVDQTKSFSSANQQDPFPLESLPNLPRVKAEHLETAFKELFKHKSWGGR